jgi:large subunit ribosomal protein L25
MESRLEAVKRESFGKNEARRLRVTGHIPAVLYGGVSGAGKREATSIAVDPKALSGILHSESGVNTLIGLTIGDEDVRVLVKEYQIDPVTSKLLHADFYRIAMDKLLTVTVPVIWASPRVSSSRAACSISSTARSRSSACRPTFRNTSSLT